MEGDTVVALGRAAADGRTLFGHNSHGPARRPPTLCRTAARAFAADDKVRTPYLELPQARQVYAVLGCRPAGRWGYGHGLNEHHVAAACVALRPPAPGGARAAPGRSCPAPRLSGSRGAWCRRSGPPGGIPTA